MAARPKPPPSTPWMPVVQAGHRWPGRLLWVVAASAFGFLVTAVFSGLLELPRAWFVAIYLVLTVLFLTAYVRWSRPDLGSLIRYRWHWGVVGGSLVAMTMVLSVQRMEASPRLEGAWLLFDLLWLGVLYGIVDALLLNVLPVVAVWTALAELGRTGIWTKRIMTGILALTGEPDRDRDVPPRVSRVPWIGDREPTHRQRNHDGRLPADAKPAHGPRRPRGAARSIGAPRDRHHGDVTASLLGFV